MFFKTFHRRRSSKSPSSPASPTSPTAEKGLLSKILTSSTAPKTATTVSTVDIKPTFTPSPDTQTGAEENRDFELFMQKAKQEDERRQKAALRAAKEMEKRRRNSNMDPWASKLGKF